MQPRKKNGQYDKSLYHCEVCGKYVGEDYFSDDNCNQTGNGMCLCQSCYYKRNPKAIEHKLAVAAALEKALSEPYGRCKKCQEPLDMEIDGADADGNRGRTIYCCRNEECEEGCI